MLEYFLDGDVPNRFRSLDWIEFVKMEMASEEIKAEVEDYQLSRHN